jgi:hypothetical protein
VLADSDDVLCLQRHSELDDGGDVSGLDSLVELGEDSQWAISPAADMLRNSGPSSPSASAGRSS